MFHCHEGSNEECLVAYFREEDHDEGEEEGVRGGGDCARFLFIALAVFDRGATGFIIIIIIIVRLCIFLVVVAIVLVVSGFFRGIFSF